MSASVQVVWTSDDVAAVSITGDSTTWTVGGSSVTFPYRITSSTTFVPAAPGRYTISVTQNGQEIAGTPDGTVVVDLREGTNFIFAPTPDTIDTAMYRLDRDDLFSGETTYSRTLASSAGTMTSGALRLAFKRATKTESIGSIIFAGAGTAAGATPTRIQAAVYEENPNTGDLTLVASSINDTSKFSSSSSGAESTLTLSSPWSKVRGRRYAIGLLVVTGATAPTILTSTVISSTAAVKTPRLCASVTGQSTLPSTITASTLNSSGTTIRPYAELVPA